MNYIQISESVLKQYFYEYNSLRLAFMLLIKLWVNVFGDYGENVTTLCKIIFLFLPMFIFSFYIIFVCSIIECLKAIYFIIIFPLIFCYFSNQQKELLKDK